MQFVLTTSHWPELEEEKERLRRFADRPDLASLTDDELVAYLRKLHPYIRDFTTNQMVAATSSGIPMGMLGAVAEAIGDSTDADAGPCRVGRRRFCRTIICFMELSRLIRDGKNYQVFLTKG